MSSLDGSESITRRSGIVERVTSLLDAVRQAGEPPTYDEIAAVARLPLSTTYRLLSTLVAQAWLAVDARGRYTLGWRSTQLGHAQADPATVRAAASEELLELGWQTNGVAHLTVLEQVTVHYLDKISNSALYHRLASAVGAKMPACMTVSGQVLLTSLPTDWVAVRHSDGPWSLAQQDRLMRIMDETRRSEGVRAIPARLHPIGVSNVAAPIVGPEGAVAAISVATLTADIDRIVPLVQGAARRISDSLFGARPQEPVPFQSAEGPLRRTTLFSVQG